VNISPLGSGAKDNTVSGNYIGIDASGTISLTNTGVGVYIDLGGQNNIIGGNQAGDRNVISRNSLDGVYIHGSTAMSNTVSGNYIGTDPSGTIDLGNVRHGVNIDGGAKYNTIGGDTAGEKNIISGNGPSGSPSVYSSGVRIYGSATMSNTVSGNYIGVDASGTISMSNDIYGVSIKEGASYNLVGGDIPGERNIISGNGWDGVYIGYSGTNYNRVSGNFIGLDKNGSGEIGNGFHGVGITGSPQYNTIGGNIEGERNVISGNADNGILIISDATNNTVIGNFIGTDSSGTLIRGNGQNGVDIYNAPNNTIGGSSQGEKNVISGNDYSGVRLFGDSTSGNTVIGNFIGTDVSGNESLGNGEHGVDISDGAHDNTIGGSTPGEGNLMCDSRFSGVSLQDSGTTGNQIIANFIGTAEDKSTDLGNGASGVRIRLGAQDNIVGPGNVIAFNYHGVTVYAIDTFGNTITQNSIYSNDYMGINLENNANKDIPAPIISGAVWGSIEVSGTACPGCQVELFESIDNDGEGKQYVGDDFADSSGDYVITVSHLIWPYLTATATDVISGTSQFSGVYTSPFRSIFLPIVFKD
jgi:titin